MRHYHRTAVRQICHAYGQGAVQLRETCACGAVRYVEEVCGRKTHRTKWSAPVGLRHESPHTPPNGVVAPLEQPTKEVT